MATILRFLRSFFFRSEMSAGEAAHQRRLEGRRRLHEWMFKDIARLQKFYGY